MPTRVRPAAALVPVLVAAGLSACSTPSSLPPRSVGVTTYPTTLPSTGGATIGRSLVTPHFSVTQQQAAVTTSVPEETADRFGLTGEGDREAPDGSEIVLVTLRGRDGGLYPADADVIPTVSVHAGDRDVAIDEWPTATALGGVAVSAVVARGAAVELRVVDDGRTVAWDLRQGRYADDPVSRAAAVLADPDSFAEGVGERRSVTGTATVTSIVAGVPDQSVPVEVTVDAGAADARVTPWLKGPGWAADGTTWLYVTGLRIRYDGRPFLTATVTEPASSLTLTPAGGAPIAAYGQGVTTSSTAIDVDGAQVVFAVPTGFRGGTFTFAPQAPIAAITAVGGSADATWTQRPPAVSFPLLLDG